MIYVTKQEGNRMKKQNELISVIMAVYNGEDYLKPAIQSVLDQTYKNFEFIIVNDASTDNTVSIIESFQDERICLIHNEKNLRLAGSLNKAIAMARGKYLLRMDADDICFPDRFEKQVTYMDKHPEIGIAFGSVLKFSGDTILREIDSNEKKPEYIRATMLFFNTVYHPNVIMRREIFEKYLYQKEYTVSEDMALWFQVAKDYPIMRMNDFTLLYRVHQGQVSTAFHEKQVEQEMQMKLPYLQKLVKEITVSEQEIHSRISRRNAEVSVSELQSWIEKLKYKNEETKVYEKNIFEYVLFRISIIVSIYNSYLPQMLRWMIAKFGMWKVMVSFIKLLGNILFEEVFLLCNLQKAQKRIISLK